MLTLTGIDQTNLEYFEPLLFTKEEPETGETHRMYAGVIEDGKPVAAAALDLDFGTKAAVITSVYTLEGARKKGAARMMLDAFEKAAAAAEMDRLECFYTDTMEGIPEFLQKEGYELWENGRAESYPISSIFSLKKVSAYLDRDPVCDVKPLKAMDAAEKKDLAEKIEEFEFGTIPADPDEELSCVALEDGEPVGVLFAHVEESGTLAQGKPVVTIDFLGSFSPYDSSTIELCLAVLEEAQADYKDARLRFYAANQKVAEFVSGFLEAEYGERICYGVKTLAQLG